MRIKVLGKKYTLIEERTADWYADKGLHIIEQLLRDAGHTELRLIDSSGAEYCTFCKVRSNGRKTYTVPIRQN